MGSGEVFEDLTERMVAGCSHFATGQSCRVGDRFVKGNETQLSALRGGVHVAGFRFWTLFYRQAFASLYLAIRFKCNSFNGGIDSVVCFLRKMTFDNVRF